MIQDKFETRRIEVAPFIELTTSGVVASAWKLNPTILTRCPAPRRVSPSASGSASALATSRTTWSGLSGSPTSCSTITRWKKTIFLDSTLWDFLSNLIFIFIFLSIPTACYSSLKTSKYQAEGWIQQFHLNQHWASPCSFQMYSYPWQYILTHQE